MSAPPPRRYTLRRFGLEMGAKLQERRHELFGRVVDLSWILLVRAIYTRIVGKEPTILERVVHATILITLSAVVTMAAADTTLVNEVVVDE